MDTPEQDGCAILQVRISSEPTAFEGERPEERRAQGAGADQPPATSLELVCRHPLNEVRPLRVVLAHDADGQECFLRARPRFLRFETYGAQARFVYWLAGRAQRK